jgi:hypothetical protein
MGVVELQASSCIMLSGESLLQHPHVRFVLTVDARVPLWASVSNSFEYGEY